MDKVIVNIGNRSYDVSNLIINERTMDLINSNNDLSSNGCGTNWFNKSLIALIESWAKIDLIKACIVHDLSYESAIGHHEEKIRIDAEFHANIYILAKDLGVPYKKARWIAKLFHTAVIIGGGSSFPKLR